MERIDYRYDVTLNIPDIKFVVDTLYRFIVVKSLVRKLATFFICDALLTHKQYTEISKLLSEKTFVGCYLTVATHQEVYTCKMNKIQEITHENYYVVKDKPLYIMKIKLEKSWMDRIKGERNVYVSMILADPKSVELSSDFSMAKVYRNVTMSDLFDEYKGKLAENDIDVYEKVNFTKYKYDQVIINNTVSLLSLPYYLHKTYRVTTGLPVFFFDTFSSQKIFGHYDVYKMMDLTNVKSWKIKDLANELTLSLFNEAILLKEVRLKDIDYIVKLEKLPSEVIFVERDGNTSVVKLENQEEEVYTKFSKDETRAYQTVKKKKEKSVPVSIHVHDSKELTEARLKKTIEFTKHIERFSRIRLTHVFFPDYDIGVLYKFNRDSTYNSIFVNLAYLFVRLNSGQFVCDVIGDVLVFDY